jgi:hypothetical protein
MARTSWLDDNQETIRIDDYARQLSPFIDAMADGRIDDRELTTQEERVAKLMKEIEPKLDDATHQRVTELLCELSAFSAMQMLRALYDARPKSTFRG